MTGVGRAQGGGAVRELDGMLEAMDGTQLVWRAALPAGAARAAIILVHGFGEHSGRYAALPAHFVPRGYAVWAYDLRGHGRSGGQRGHIMAWAEFHDDLRRFVALVRAAEPRLPLFLYGHSMGGLLALEYGSQHPDDLAGIVVSAPGLRWDLPPIVVWLVRALSRHWPTFSGGSTRDHADPLTHTRASVRLISEERAAMARMMVAPTISVPLLIAHDTADPQVPVEASRAFYACITSGDKTLQEEAGHSHFPHSAPGADAFLEKIVDWLDRHLC